MGLVLDGQIVATSKALSASYYTQRCKAHAYVDGGVRCPFLGPNGIGIWYLDPSSSAPSLAKMIPNIFLNLTTCTFKNQAASS